MSRRGRIALGLAALALLTGCGGGTGPGNLSASATGSPTATPTRTPYVFDTPPPISDRALTTDGLGPIRLGTPVDQAVRLDWAVRDARCGWRTAPGLLAEGVELRFGADDRISDIWLGNSTYGTAEGARVGMVLEQIETLFGEDLAYERRDSPAGSALLPIVRRGDRELLFFGLGDEDATPGPRAPLTGIAARAYGLDVTRPTC